MIKAFKVLLENNKSGQIETVYMWKGVASRKNVRKVTDPELKRAMKDWKAREVVVSTAHKVMLKEKSHDEYYVEYNNA